MAATPSGVSLSPEGGAHQSVITPGIGVALPAIRYFEPAFAQEVEWILLDALARAPRPASAARASTCGSRPSRSIRRWRPRRRPSTASAVLRGGYRLIDARGEPGWDPEDNAVHIFAAGVMVPEAVEAARELPGRGRARQRLRR